MIIINKFNQINIIPNSLVMIDIDDTLIKFDGIDHKWWENKFNKYFKMTKNNDLADFLAHNDWIKIVSSIEPELVDDQIYNFIETLNKNNCHIVILTARNDKLKDLTIKHLQQVNLSFDNVHFNNQKGDHLYNIAHQYYHHLDNIIVIDDMVPNLEDIKNKLKDTKFNLQLYNIKS